MGLGITPSNTHTQKSGIRSTDFITNNAFFYMYVELCVRQYFFFFCTLTMLSSFRYICWNSFRLKFREKNRRHKKSFLSLWEAERKKNNAEIKKQQTFSLSVRASEKGEIVFYVCLQCDFVYVCMFFPPTAQITRKNDLEFHLRWNIYISHTHSFARSLSLWKKTN